MKRDNFEEAKRWIIQAEDEFKDADELRKLGKFYLALFHFQQAAEKALKGYLFYKTSSTHIFYTHSIDEPLNFILKEKKIRKIDLFQKIKFHKIVYKNRQPTFVNYCILLNLLKNLV